MYNHADVSCWMGFLFLTKQAKIAQHLYIGLGPRRHSWRWLFWSHRYSHLPELLWVRLPLNEHLGVTSSRISLHHSRQCGIVWVMNCFMRSGRPRYTLNFENFWFLGRFFHSDRFNCSTHSHPNWSFLRIGSAASVLTWAPNICKSNLLGWIWCQGGDVPLLKHALQKRWCVLMVSWWLRMAVTFWQVNHWGANHENKFFEQWLCRQLSRNTGGHHSLEPPSDEISTVLKHH